MNTGLLPVHPTYSKPFRPNAPETQRYQVVVWRTESGAVRSATRVVTRKTPAWPLFPGETLLSVIHYPLTAEESL